MFGYDPIDLFDPSPYLAVSYYGHLVIGLVAFAAAAIAFGSRKGGKWHVLAGKVFIVAVLVVCLTTASMLSEVFIPPLFLAGCTAAYVVLTAYLALKPGKSWVCYSEYALFVFEVAAVATFLMVALPNVAEGQVPLFAPLIMIGIPIILLIGDLNWFFNAGKRRQLRIRRHLARMIWAIIIVVRAPLVEIAAAGVPIPAPVLLLGPFIVAAIVLYWTQRRFGEAKS